MLCNRYLLSINVNVNVNSNYNLYFHLHLIFNRRPYCKLKLSSTSLIIEGLTPIYYLLLLWLNFQCKFQVQFFSLLKWYRILKNEKLNYGKAMIISFKMLNITYTLFSQPYYYKIAVI